MTRRLKCWYKNLSLRYKFLSFYIITTVLLISLTLVFNAISTEAIVNKAVTQSARETRLIADALDEYFYDARGYSRLLAIDLSLQQSLVQYNNSTTVLERTQIRSELYYRVSSYLIAKAEMTDVCVLDQQLLPVYENRVSGQSTSELLHEMGFTFEDVPINGVYTGLVELPTRRGPMSCVALAKAIIDSDHGNRIGVVVFFIAEDLIYKKYTATGQYIGDFTIIDDKGSVISSTNRGLLGDSASLPELELLRASGRDSLITHGSGDKLLLVSSEMPRMHWQVINHLPLRLVTQENVQLTKWLILLAVGFLLLGIACNTVVSRSVIAPILRLKAVMEATAGDQSTRLRMEVTARDEVGVLSSRFNEMMDNIDMLILENNRQQQFAREYEFRLLQAQINPHFLYNTLEMIIMLTGLGLTDKAVKATQGLADFYRLTLSHGAQVIPIKDEMALTASYLSIQAYRYVEYMRYEMDVDPAVEGCTIPKLTIQPLVENAIYHGIKEKGEGLIRLTAYPEGDDAVISIWDNGAGMPPQKARELLAARALDQGNQSFGIVSVNTKLKLTYGEQYGLFIDSAEGEYTRVQVRLPGKR